MNILQVCAYAADYEGNFIKSLRCLDNMLCEKGHRTIYVFPENAKSKDWCIKLSEARTVYFLPLARARIKIKTYITMRKIIKDEKIDIIHSHFELYDIPCNIMSRRNVKVFWHLHDPINKGASVSRNLLNKIQYSICSKNVTLISVSDYYKKFVIEMGFDKKNAITVLNGIDLERVKISYSGNKKYDFLTFGWDFRRKGGDIIFKALDSVEKEGYNFKLLFNCNENTMKDINEYFDGNDMPQWLEIGLPVENINELFSETKWFIQASRRETFSYAVCEASYAGLGVIASDIPGLEWAHKLSTISFFENEDVEQLKKLVKACLDEKIKFSYDDINKSRNVIYKEFSKEVWAKKIISLYMDE